MEKFDTGDLKTAIAKMGMLKFFPSDPDVRAEISAELARMCVSRESLEWLTAALIRKVGEWPGVMEMRGIYCSHWPPADGDNVCSTIGEFSADANECRAIEEHRENKRLTGQRTRQLIDGHVCEEIPVVPSLPEVEDLRDAVRRAAENRLANARPVIDPADAERAKEGLKKLGVA